MWYLFSMKQQHKVFAKSGPIVRKGVVKELDSLLQEHGLFGAIVFAERHSDRDPNTGCWIWNLTKNRRGYSVIIDPRINELPNRKTKVYFHRLVCEAAYGTMGKDVSTRHKCDVTSCVNPDHLEPGTHQENIADYWRRVGVCANVGQNNWTAVLTADEVIEIRKTYRRFVKGEGKRFAKKYNVTYGTILGVVNGNLWKSVPGVPDKTTDWPKRPVGELNTSAILNAAQVTEIRLSSARAKVLAPQYGVSMKTIYDVRQRVSWRHLP